MNPEFPSNPREELELRVTSLLLGELSEAEAASVRAAIAKDPELQKLHDDLKQTIHLVREATVSVNDSTPEQTESLKLSEERRKSLIAAFVIPPLKPEHVRQTARFRVRLIEVFVAVAILVVVISISTPALRSMKTRQAAAMQDDVMLLDAAKHQWALETGKPADAEPTAEELKAYKGRGDAGELSTPVAAEKNVLGKGGEPVVAKLDARRAKGGRGNYPERVQVSGQVATVTNAVAFASWMENRQKGLESPSLRGFYDDNYSASPTVAGDKSVVTVGAAEIETISGRKASSETFTDRLATIVNKAASPAAGDFVPGSNPTLDQAGKDAWFAGTAGKFGDAEAEESAPTSIRDRNMFGLQPAPDPASLAPASTASPGFIDKRRGNHVAGTVVEGDMIAQEPAAPQGPLSETTLSGYADTSLEWKSKATDESKPVDGRNVSLGFSLNGSGTDGAVSQRGGPNDPALTEATRRNTSFYRTEGGVPPASGLPPSQRASSWNKSGTGALALGGTNPSTDVEKTPNWTKDRVENATKLQNAKLLFESGKYDEAEILLKQVREVEPGNYAAAYYSSLAKEQRDANASLSRAVQSKDRILSVEKAWEVPSSREKLPAPTSSAQPDVEASSTFAFGGNFGARGVSGQEGPKASGGKGSNIYAMNIVGYVDAPIATNFITDPEWVGVPERPSKPAEGANKFVGRYAYVTPPTESESLARAKRENNIVLPATPSASDSLLTAGLREVNRSPVPDVSDLGAPLNLGEESKSTDLEHTKETQPYLEKKRELDNLVSFQKILEQRLAMEKVDVTLPRTGMVTVMNRAVAPNAADKGVLGRIGQALKGDYQATASVKVDRPGADITELSGRNVSGVYDPYFIQTEFEAIKSETVLTNVVTSLGLTNKWADKKTGGKPLTMAEATDKLRARLELSPVRNSQFVQIQGKSSDPTEAATIANAVAEAYQQHRLAEIKGASEGGIRALEERLKEHQAKVKKATQELASLREGAKPSVPATIIDAPLPRKPATNAPVAQPEIQTSENNFSTFSLNVSDVSFKLAAASLEKGQMPDSASIRSEEFINAFDYRDPEPKWDSASSLSAQAGKMPAPLAFAWERARYPFAHNRDLLRFSLKTAAAGRQAGRPLNIVLLLDNSGSMERADRVGIIREALRVLAKQLQPQDKLSVITFARTPRLVADGITGDKAGEVAERVSGLTPEGGTNLEDAMNLAYQTAAKHFQANGINRVVVLTDGAANLGNVEPESLKQKVEAQRQQGIALDCFGIGWEGFNDDLLEVLSRNGDGRYGFINSPEEAASEFAGQLAGALKVAASDVKVQVEFNPKRVMSYRQIGYAKHQLTKEQFRDNTVDAAEIAAQEAGNALYTVEVNPAGQGPLATVHVRYKIPGTTDYREQAWDVPFSGNAVALEQSSAAMRLATSAGAFSEWLAVNPFSSEITPDALLKTISGVPEAFGADPRPKKLEWMIRQAKSLEGN